MIRLNLIEATNRTNSSTGKTSQVIFEPPTEKRNKKGLRFLLTALLVVALGISLFTGALMILGVPASLQEVLPSPVLSFLGVPEKTDLPLIETTGITGKGAGVRVAPDSLMLQQKNKRVSENLAKDIQPALFIPKNRTNFETFLPPERLVYQNQILNHLLTFIGTATPENVSFSDIVFRAPHFYFVRAVAGDPMSQKGYLDRLKNVSTQFKTPELPENAPATAITAFGEFAEKPLPIKTSAITFISEADVLQELEKFAQLDSTQELKFSGLKKKPVVEDFGMYRRFLYQLSTQGDFQDIAKFVNALQASSVRVGVEQLELRPTPKKEGVQANFQVVLLVVPE